MTYPSNWAVSWVNQETPALDVSAIDYVIQGDREYCRLQQELAWANEQNDGNAIARIHDRLDAINAWTIRSRAETLLHGLGFYSGRNQSCCEILLRWLANEIEFSTGVALPVRFIVT